MSSHREAPAISNDPVADNTDLYAFVSPDKPTTVTIIANYLPLEEPAGGPNFFRFGDDVVYQIRIANNGPENGEITYEFRFTTVVGNPNTFLYNLGPITSLTDPNWNVKQTYSVTRITPDARVVLGSGIPTPPCRIGPRSTPNYPNLAASAVTSLSTGEVVFAGQRADPFFVDLGSIFDLGDLRPFQNLHLIPTPAGAGINGLKGYNCHTIAIQIPITMLTISGSMPTGVMDKSATIGVWASAWRQASRVLLAGQQASYQGNWVQVSRLGHPLINEVIIPLGMKDYWNMVAPQVRQPVRIGVRRTGTGQTAAGAVPEGVPQPGRAEGRAGRSRGDPADGYSRGHHSWIPEPHRLNAGRLAAAQHGGSTHRFAKRDGDPRW